MLRVGLTGEMGSGKSTVARFLAEQGAVVMSSDEIGRELMQPGQLVYSRIVEHFGPQVVLPGGQLDRPALAQLAFDQTAPRVEELNRLIHPAVIAEQERRLATIASEHRDAIVVIESALIFTTQHGGGPDRPWRNRFDRIVLVTATEEQKIARFVERGSKGQTLSEAQRETLRKEALARLHAQRISAEAASKALLIVNNGDLAMLARRTEEVFQQLRSETPPG